jgi:hypothetical protein
MQRNTRSSSKKHTCQSVQSVRENSNVAPRLSQKRASGERQAEENENGEEHGKSVAVPLPAIGGLIEKGRGFTGGIRLLFVGLRGIQRAYSFKIVVGK